MSVLRIDWEWRLLDFLHVGTGLSRAGYAAGAVRLNSQGNAVLEGGGVKGAIRGAAERLCRELCRDIPAEKESDSMPQHPMLRRVFSPDGGRGRGSGPFFRFPDAFGSEGHLVTLSSTAINVETGSARQGTLRTVEAWFGGSLRGRVELHCPDLEAFEAAHPADLDMLTAAILATDAVGGKKSSGMGAVECVSLSLSQFAPAAERVSEARMQRLKDRLQEEAAHALLQA